MKKIILGILVIFLTIEVKPQPSQEIGKIALSVITPENLEGLDASQLSKIKSKITQIVSSTGLAASGYNNNFVIYPIFSIFETNVVEGGMENITVITCELSLFIKQVDNNVIFSSISKQLKGSGKTKSLAITNAISKIPTNDSDFNLFIETGKNKISAYYESKCGDIILKSESLVKMQDYEQALGLLMTVPEEVSCYNKVQEKAIEAYKSYQIQKCNVQLIEAKTMLASNNYSATLNILSNIDPSTPCFKEVENIIKNTEEKLDTEKRKQWELKMQVYNDNLALEKERISAIKEIAIAYYKSKPTTISYNYIIR